MKIRYIICIIGLLAFSLMGSAKDVDYATAEKIAKQFHSLLYQTDGTNDNVACDLIYTGHSTTRSGQSLYYIFNYEKGFVIVPGNDLVPPVLAYSANNKFVADNPACTVRSILDYYSHQMASMVNLTGDAHPQWEDLSSILSTTTDGTADELLYTTALWYQYAPYNKYCPIIDGSGCATGCVATALSIAMKYRQWPDVGVGSYSYVWDKMTISTNFDVTYQWDDMLMEYKEGEYTEAQGDAVATVMFRNGVLSEMEYGVAGSGAFTNNAVRGVIDYMKYDKSVIQLTAAWYATDKWIDMVKAEIKDNGPMIYGGYDADSGGHQFILDGYRNNYFHVNWGWAGSSDGYFLITDLNPFTDQPTLDGFSDGAGGIFNFKPAVEGSTYTYLFVFGKDEINNVDYAGLKASTSTFKEGVEFSVQAGVYFNQSLVAFTGELAVMLCNASGEVKEDISGLYHLQDFTEGSFHEFICTIKQPIETGDYICLMFKSEESTTWQMVIGGSGITTMIPVSDSATAIEEVTSPTISVENIGQQMVMTSDSPMTQVKLYSSTGMLLEQKELGGQYQATLSMEHLPKSIYIVQIETVYGISRHKVVNH